LADKRLVKVDAVYLTREDELRQKKANAQLPRPRLIYCRLMFPPTLVIESVSIGHEAHDYETKRAWYAEFGIPNYWLINAHPRTLDWLVLDGQTYRVDQAGQQKDELRPSLFSGLVIKLGELWLD
jgi:Uma2 family endonuclease